jgi:Cu2+-exporting ATPase
MRAQGFCCAGCAYVFRLIQEESLGQYYRIKDRITAPADGAVFEPRDYGWLESAQAAAEASAAAGRRRPELDLDLQGVSCAGCVWLIERLFQQERGGRAVFANAQFGSLKIVWQPGEFSAAGFARRLQCFGYLVGPRDAKAPDPESRGLVRRVGLCAAFALNVMLFTLPSYFGMARTFPYAGLFGILSLGFATLSVLVGGSYFIGRAWRAARLGVLHIDLPIALGIAGSYAGSLYGWLTGDRRLVYFDFLGTFIVLMLAGRLAQIAAVERNRRRLLSRHPRPTGVRLADSPGAEIPLDGIEPGTAFLAGGGQAVPVEGRLLSPAATLSLASINGEAAPRLFRAGQTVPAGALNVGRDDVLIEARERWRDSLLARLLEPGERAGWRHAFLERIVRWYLWGILATACLSGIGWWAATRDPARSWSVVTAVLVVSCPCAIGLAFPLADEMATSAARRHGVFVRENDLWAKLRSVRRLVFDKTGTLTLETPVLENPEVLESLDPEGRSALLALVRDSRHPVSRCLLENLLAQGPCRPRQGDVSEEVGSGVVQGPWSLGRAGWRSPEPAGGADAAATDLARDGRLVARFYFGDEARPDARREISLLRRSGFGVSILSGDDPFKVARLAAELGLPDADAIGRLSPGGKADWLGRTGAADALMLGDGANDSLAFDRALCRGTPVVHRGVLEGKADFYYLGKGISGLRALLEVGRLHRRTLAWVVGFSAAYNLSAVAFAVCGAMNPLVAAVLMPASSLVTVALVTGGMRRAGRALPAAGPGIGL